MMTQRSRRGRIARLAFIFIALAPARPAAIDVNPVLAWSYYVVGTPEFYGPSKIGQPGFIPPAALRVTMPESFPCPSAEAMGQYEVYLGTTGAVESVQSRHEPADGNICQQTHVFPVIRGWLFSPAIYEDRPMPVYMRVVITPR
jgi:hypothetical protein